MKTNRAGRIGARNRRALVAPAREFARANDLPVNFVLSAVLWKGERLDRRVTFTALTALINPDTMSDYVLELARRDAARAAQMAGMVRRALPRELRTEENIRRVAGDLEPGLCIPLLKNVIEMVVEQLATPLFQTGHRNDPAGAAHAERDQAPVPARMPDAGHTGN